ncbi:amidohydrolase family protein [Micromonospora sp. Llam7]|uniref:amidohydrolase family protein n=1 Tax=Micromonospora tarapacensis TaxID=2835305 RepID=UPI001C82F8F1|nr:amidohydrolase family protein [Micromonospora tarapacensis]MBX7266887.1 amidohydrolase family protein [Micromonospora tarapacensis]
MLISADSHLLDPPHLWQRWLPARYRDRAPQLVEDVHGGHAWRYAGTREPEPIGLAGLPGRPADRLRPSGVRYDEIRPGTYDGAARLADQDADGVAAEVIFPSARPLGHFLDDPDPDFVRAGVAAYNRFVVEEFCAAAPTRLFPVAQLPTTGVEDCRRTLSACADRGFVAAVLPSWPTGGDHLDAASAPFWAQAQEIGLPICMHVGFRSRQERLLLRELHERRLDDDLTSIRLQPADPRQVPRPLEYHHRAPNFGVSLGRAAAVLSDLLLSGLFDTYPRLRIGLIETWIGWLPRALEAVDDIWRRNRYLRRIPLRQPPSAYWHTNMAASFLDDRAGVHTRHAIGVDSMMWSTDYPHFGTFWPRSREVAEITLAGVPEDERARILAGNCLRFYGLTDRIGAT